MAEVAELEAKFRSLPKGSAESNKAFREWRDAVNNAPPAEPEKPARKSAGRVKK